MIITLTTDFGTADTYVAQMKGVILGIAPCAILIDVTHAVPPQDVLAAALALESLVGAFPLGTIHIAVVDPGVGSDRAVLAVRTENGIWIAPDNGLLTAVMDRERIIETIQLTNAQYHRQPVSATFHGRDIFAPVAAHLATGVPLSTLGEPASTPKRLPLPQPIVHADSLELHAIHTDRFGNVITDLIESQLESWRHDQPNASVSLQAGNETIDGISRTFADITPGKPLAYIGSGGRLEIAIRNGHAATELGLAPGSIISLKSGD